MESSSSDDGNYSDEVAHHSDDEDDEDDSSDDESVKVGEVVMQLGRKTHGRRSSKKKRGTGRSSMRLTKMANGMEMKQAN